jgi:hypothetical protein
MESDPIKLWIERCLNFKPPAGAAGYVPHDGGGGCVMSVNGVRMMAPPDPRWETPPDCCAKMTEAVERGEAFRSGFQESNGQHYLTYIFQQYTRTTCPFCQRAYPLKG